jgi:hypothetical protein
MWIQMRKYWACATQDRAFPNRLPKLSIIFAEILSRAHGAFEHQNGVLESSKIAINNSILLLLLYVIIIVYYYCFV